MSRLDRREFIWLSTLTGLSACAGKTSSSRPGGTGSGSTPAVIKEAKVLDERPIGTIPEASERLLIKLSRKEITPDQYFAELGKIYAELDVDRALLSDWIAGEAKAKDIPMFGGKFLWFKAVNPTTKMFVFTIPANTTHPTHAHHNLITAQCYLQGTVHMRQYEKVPVQEAKAIGLKLVEDQPRVGFHQQSLLMNERYRNVHSFSAYDEDVVVFNIVVERHYDKSDTFLGEDGARTMFVDATGPKKPDGTIVARYLTDEEAMASFSKKPLSAFKP